MSYCFLGRKTSRDFAILIDATSDMGHENFAEQISFISKLLHHLPFSPSLPSFGVVAIDKGSRRMIDSEELINRESLIQRLKDVT